jgi:hypothetical protein
LEYQYFSQQLLNYDETKGTGIMKDEFIDELGVTIASLEKPGSSEYTKP